MNLNLSDHILNGTVIPGAPFFGSRWGDRLEITLADKKTIKIAIEILPPGTTREKVNFGVFSRWKGHWTYAQIGGQNVLINRGNAFKRFGQEKIDKFDVVSGITQASISEQKHFSEWKLFSDPKFKVMERISDSQLENIKNYILINHSKNEPTHIPPSVSGLTRAIEFVDGKGYFLLNKKKKGDWKSRGQTKAVCDAICLNDGTIHASGSFSMRRVGSCFTEAEFRSNIARERKAMAHFKGDNQFMQEEHFIEYRDKKGHYKARIIMPKYTCDVFSILNDPQKYGITDADRFDIGYQIIEIVHRVHQKGWLLRDIKLENFLLKKEKGEWKVVCCDLEMFCANDDDIEKTRVCGTAPFLSPEFLFSIATGKQIATQAHDIWALGLTLSELFGVYEKEREVICSYQSTKLWCFSSANMSPPISAKEELVWGMLQQNPSERMSSHGALDLATRRRSCYLNPKKRSIFSVSCN